ncbi:hypothetical protein CWB96_00255 [Pseudoalteromonas citrea]|uniref:DEAD/DEAH box helicase n=1 Tax=Pseudoalteromonas citrea TaxID=43655 RepID=A0A5S3XVG6_9GAMM|nr:DEAD/DEAH box helicase [Pseudoalteromonas citrea]TMP46298.1 hypothetical protein CWB97_02250 [Pseudoalteromonas citrea]TMP63074.1 hypothetical protein CWB96_00255 [Pseudoalteromonas citrea]
MLNQFFDWAYFRWGFVTLALDDSKRIVIKTVDGRCERWLCTGIDAQFNYSIPSVKLVTYDTISNLTVQEYVTSPVFKDVLEAVSAAADKQDVEIASLEYCPKCLSHKVSVYSCGRAMKLCSDFSVCSKKALSNGRTYPLTPLNSDQQQFLFSQGEDDLSVLPGDVLASMAQLDWQSTDIPLLENALDLVSEQSLIPTSSYENLDYSFSHFNRVQSTLLHHNVHSDNVNLVLATTTSSGKTVCAELCMAEALNRGKKVLYVSPLRALTQEKYEQWGELFVGRYSVGIMTGDYSQKLMQSSGNEAADILCVTSEMLDSKTRKKQVEVPCWIDEIGLVVVDESHIIGTERGHAVEAGLMRFTRFNSAKVIMMSATMPNVADFSTWLTALNGLKTYIIHSSWRPTALTWHFNRIPETGNYQQNKRAKIAEVIKLVRDVKATQEKYLLFVHDKATGKELVKRLVEEGVQSEFHSASLKSSERHRIESEFKDINGNLKVLVSTSTLAWGCNVPAKNVVITGTKRGLTEVELADIMQMAGRAGRSLPADYYIVSPDASCFVQSSLDRLSLGLLAPDTGVIVDKEEQIIDLRTHEQYPHGVQVAEHANPMRAHRKIRI